MDADAVRQAYTDEVFGQLSRYVEILAHRGIDWGLIGPGETGRLWERHVLNSLAVLPWVDADCDVVDVGSGAGLPGIPVAMVRPGVRMTLLEPMERRCEFLREVVAELGLESRVAVLRGRAEEQTAQYRVVLARALAPMAKLVGWCAPLVAAGGRLVALKGRSASEELGRARGALGRASLEASVHEVTVPGTSEPTWVIVGEAR